MKSISTINSAIMENTKISIVKTRAPAFDLKVGVLLDRSLLLFFVSGYFDHFG